MLVVPAIPGAPAVDVDQEAGEGRRYVAVVSEVPGVEVFAEEQPADEGRRADRRADRYSTDIPILIVSALLAASTFLDWYKGSAGFGINSSGWQSGTWGPLILFLAAGSVVLVALRRLGVHVSLPFEESLLHEGVGWLSLVGAVVKRLAPPGPKGLLTASYGMFIAIGAAAVLIILAGRMQPHAPLHVRPGWHRAKAGAFGIALILAVVAGATAFGVINKAEIQPSADQNDLLSGTVRGRLPDCAKDFPLPPGLAPQYGFGSGAACQAQLSSTSSSQDVANAFRALLRSKNYAYTEVPGAPGSVILTITKPRCATLAVVPQPEPATGSIVAVALTPCVPRTSTPRSSPRAASSPSP